ncbi:hypothetical protein DKG34_05550 [Streptomyces sp. NWU49]|nr:hypothetical protein DKG34_05550 [Streptomyces sp. NWU49]
MAQHCQDQGAAVVLGPPECGCEGLLHSGFAQGGPHEQGPCFTLTAVAAGTEIRVHQYSMQAARRVFQAR